MKNLTEIVKNVKTSGKNLIVYSSMLLALGGAYACGGNDNSGNNAADAQVLQDGGSSNQDGGSSNALLDCDNFCLARKNCECGGSIGYPTDIEGCKSKCKSVITKLEGALTTEYFDGLNNWANIYSGPVYTNGTKVCTGDITPGSCSDDNLKPYFEACCKKAVECNMSDGKTEEECISEPYYACGFTGDTMTTDCLTNDLVNKNKECIENFECSSEKFNTCRLPGLVTLVGDDIKIFHCDR